jgi:hypothetical protein
MKNQYAVAIVASVYTSKEALTRSKTGFSSGLANHAGVHLFACLCACVGPSGHGVRELQYY